MDPNACIEEQIRLLKHAKEHGWDDINAHRYRELKDAYMEWRLIGGFAARPELLREAQELRDEMFGAGTGVSGAELASRQMTGVNPYASSWRWRL